MECRMLNGCKTGQAKITKGYRLPARHVIHTVGPVWQGGTEGEPDLLASCYATSLRLGAEHGCAAIAFPAISQGRFGFPPELATDIAVTTVADTLPDLPAILQVTFCCFSAASAALHQQAIERL